MNSITTKRIYDQKARTDGFRILVDRLWPRGVKKENAEIDAWFKETAPSSELRKWFAHDPEKWEAFKKKYNEELKGNEAVDELMALIKKHHRITLVYAAKDEQHNQAIVLKQYLERKQKNK